MSSIPKAIPESAIPIDAMQLLQMLQSNEQSWVVKSKVCQQLQQVGFGTDAIFDATGLEPIQQDQMAVAAQVYSSLERGNAPKPVLAYFEGCYSDILYEFRILSQIERVHAATLAVAKHLDVDEAKAVAIAIQAFSSFTRLPKGFSEHSGDAVAYQCWVSARQQTDLQERSQVIARGLRFAHSDSARRQLETLLTNLTAPQ